jgi:hypothetical protein
MKFKGIILSLTVIGVLLIFTACAKDHMRMKMSVQPFGSETEISYTRDLWRVLVKEKLAGPERIRAIPYEGMEPHGVILEQFSTLIKIKAHKGMVHVKSNYMGKDISRSKVVNDPDTYLRAITVMFKREKGYDPENQDWFWAKYKPDGTLHANPKGVLLAGRVAKGMRMGCIACHRSADGGDYLFNNSSSQLD